MQRRKYLWCIKRVLSGVTGRKGRPVFHMLITTPYEDPVMLQICIEIPTIFIYYFMSSLSVGFGDRAILLNVISTQKVLKRNCSCVMEQENNDGFEIRE